MKHSYGPMLTAAQIRDARNMHLVYAFLGLTAFALGPRFWIDVVPPDAAEPAALLVLLMIVTVGIGAVSILLRMFRTRNKKYEAIQGSRSDLIAALLPERMVALSGFVFAGTTLALYEGWLEANAIVQFVVTVLILAPTTAFVSQSGKLYSHFLPRRQVPQDESGESTGGRSTEEETETKPSEFVGCVPMSRAWNLRGWTLSLTRHQSFVVCLSGGRLLVSRSRGGSCPRRGGSLGGSPS